MNNPEENLTQFIEEEKVYFNSLNTGITWADNIWELQTWLFHRGKDTKVSFSTKFIFSKKFPVGINIPNKIDLPLPYQDFVKALAVYLQRKRNSGYMSIRNYIYECKRLYIFMYNRNENSPIQLTRWHFERTLTFLKEIEYKNLYDAAANLKIISEVIDQKKLTEIPIKFEHGMKSSHKYYDYKALTDISDDEQIKGEGKLPSYEAMQAYAICTNNPINNFEEILLRTIDLLITMGQRGNEVALLPLDCWVEKKIVDNKGNIQNDTHGNPIISIGIKYYAEKQFQSRVHWLADQDIPFAKRAVDRLKELTKVHRETAKWQEDNPGKLWQFEKDYLIDEITILKYIGFVKPANLRLFLTSRNGIKPAKILDIPMKGSRGKVGKTYYYRAGDIEEFLLPKINEHIALKEFINGKWNIILKTSEVLAIRPEGAFRFIRGSNTFYILPNRIQIEEINGALGSKPGAQSIFERRKLTEADGSKIQLTSHTPRHWRNTLYELAGMSNVQQALALGRQNLNQNATYQHTTLKERTSFHKQFLSFNSPAENVKFVQNGVRSKSILGDITETYHFLKETKNLDSAESFLKTHAMAIHLTPFGGCTHDFSQAPCTKHLQCWNGCSHLHRTNTPGEKERLEEQLKLSEEALSKMEEDSDEYGHNVWKEDLQNKILNLKKGLEIKVSSSPTPVFPDGKPFTLGIDERKKSSVKKE